MPYDRHGEEISMSWSRASRINAFLQFSMMFLLYIPTLATADEDDPPSRAARLAYIEGAVSLSPGGTEDWVAAPVNRPLTAGDQLWSDRDSRVELQMDGSLLRLSSNTSASFLNLNDNVTQIQLSTGTMLVRVRRLDDNETYEIDTPNLAFTILRPGLYRLSVDQSGNTTAIGVRSGQGEVTGAGFAYSVHANEYDVFSGTDELAEQSQSYGPDEDPFDAWSSSRDARWERSLSARYVSPDVVGYEDLDDHGAWTPTPEYGYVWFPRGVDSSWAPYHSGHWSYIAPWGYTWVDDQPWGFAPFHYGRWISVDGAWGWVPSPPRVEGAVYVRPVYAPALVAWVGVGAGVAWFALGPREVYVPSYPVSRNYANNINVSNTTVNRTVINNVYETTVINNRTVNATTNVTYVNRSVPGAVAATTAQAFTTAQPISKNLVRVDQHAVASAPVQVFAPASVPTKQAVLGGNRAAAVRPPAAVQTRAIVARSAPPPPPPTFEKQQQAIQNNGGKPLSAIQLRNTPATSAQRGAAVRIAPPATPAMVRPRVGPAAPSNEAPAHMPVRPPAAIDEVTRPAPTAVHPQEIPAPPKPASPSVANSALERQHLQEQQQLHAQQEMERQRVQQQQEMEHQQLAKQQADAARQQQLEQQHRQQTEQLAAQHAEQLRQLEQKQEEQKKQQESKPAPKNPKDDRPPNERH